MTRSSRWNERGAVLSVALLIAVVLLASGGLALWSLRGELSGAGQDRRARQLLARAERALAQGKQFFGVTGWSVRDAYLAAMGCSALPCPPFSAGAPGPAVTGYPGAAPFSGEMVEGGARLTYVTAIYNNPESPASPFADRDNQVIVWARCQDPGTGQSRSVQAVVSGPAVPMSPGDYRAQAGSGLRNQGNAN